MQPFKQKPAWFALSIVVFREILFWNIQLQKPSWVLIVLVCTLKYNSYLLAFIIANLLNHWWLDFMVFCCTFLMSVYFINGWVVGGKNYQSGHPWNSHDASRCPHNSPCLICRPHNSRNSIDLRSPPPNWHPPLPFGAIVPVVTLESPSRKAD